MRIGHFHLCGTGISRAAAAFLKLFGRKLYGIVSQ